MGLVAATKDIRNVCGCRVCVVGLASVCRGEAIENSRH